MRLVYAVWPSCASGSGSETMKLRAAHLRGCKTYGEREYSPKGPPQPHRVVNHRLGGRVFSHTAMQC